MQVWESVCGLRAAAAKKTLEYDLQKPHEIKASKRLFGI
jgi:hypothetical protein